LINLGTSISNPAHLRCVTPLYCIPLLGFHLSVDYWPAANNVENCFLVKKAAYRAAVATNGTAVATNGTAAGTSGTAAGTSEMAAGTSETAAGTSEMAAGTSETAAGTRRMAAGTSGMAAGTSGMAGKIYEKAAYALPHEAFVAARIWRRPLFGLLPAVT
jgi:hypothetical protein